MQKNIYRRKNIKRSPYRLPRKNSKKDKQSLFSKIVIQLLASAIILIVVLGIQNIDTPITNTVSDKIENSILHTTDFDNAYEAVETFKNRINVIPDNINKSEDETDSIEKEDETLDLEGKKMLPDNKETSIPSINSQDHINEDILSIKELEEKVDISNEPKPIDKMLCPVNGVVSSYFGMRKHPLYDQEIFHSGIDIDAPNGTDILSVAKGEIIEVGESTSYGKYIRIKHSELMETFYAHCSEILVQNGDKIEAGDIIGKVGNTGNSLGSHLHFEIVYDGKHINPLNYIQLSQDSSNVKV